MHTIERDMERESYRCVCIPIIYIYIYIYAYVHMSCWASGHVGSVSEFPLLGECQRLIINVFGSHEQMYKVFMNN